MLHLGYAHYLTSWLCIICCVLSVTNRAQENGAFSNGQQLASTFSGIPTKLPLYVRDYWNLEKDSLVRYSARCNISYFQRDCYPFYRRVFDFVDQLIELWKLLDTSDTTITAGTSCGMRYKLYSGTHNDDYDPLLDKWKIVSAMEFAVDHMANYDSSDDCKAFFMTIPGIGNMILGPSSLVYTTQFSKAFNEKHCHIRIPFRKPIDNISLSQEYNMQMVPENQELLTKL